MPACAAKSRRESVLNGDLPRDTSQERFHRRGKISAATGKKNATEDHLGSKLCSFSSPLLAVALTVRQPNLFGRTHLCECEYQRAHSPGFPCWCPSRPPNAQTADIICCDRRPLENCWACAILSDNPLGHQ